MGTPDGYTNCEQITSYYTHYPVLIAALLWCRVPIEQVEEHREKANEIKTGFFSLPYMPCLELKCRAIHEAINSGELPVCRENGVVVDDNDHVAPARRHVRREDLKAWIAKKFPDDMPAFLLDKITEIEPKLDAINPRLEITYLNIIGAMLELMLSSSPAGKKLSVYDNQAAIVEALLSYNDGKQGLKKRTLEEKFAEAKRSFNSH